MLAFQNSCGYLWYFQKVSLNTKFIILLCSKNHTFNESVRRLVYLTLHDFFFHFLSSANRCDSTGDNNLSLPLSSVKATDFITSALLTALSASKLLTFSLRQSW